MWRGNAIPGLRLYLFEFLGKASIVNVRWMVIVGVAVGLICSSGSGQVTRVQQGRRLDSSYRIGSGGVNSVRQYPVGLRSQLFVTGQVSGLARFRGGVPYVGSDELLVDLPSARQGIFRKTSVGILDVLGGSPYLTTPYYDPSKTVFGVNRIGAGLTLPGSSVPVTPTLKPSPFAPLDTRLDGAYYLGVTTGRPRVISPTSSILSGPLLADPYEERKRHSILEPGAAGLYGVVRLRELQRTARREYEIVRREQPDQTQADTQLEERIGSQIESQIESQVESQIETKVDARLETRINPVYPGLREAPGRIEPNEPDRLPLQLETGQIPAVPLSPGKLIPETDQDVYLGLLIQMRKLAQGALSPQLRPGFVAESTLATDLEGESSEQPASPIVFDPIGRTLVIRALAGTGKDMFNKHMAKAEKHLRTGRFYDAVGEYEVAIMANSSNPLARMGLSVALFAAGEPLGMSIHLRRAFELFPPIMETRLDLKRMLSKKVITMQLERIDDQLKRKEILDPIIGGHFDPRLALVSTFIHHNLGHVSVARDVARKLQQAAGDDELLKTYATFILTERQGEGKTKGEAVSTKPEAK